MKFDIPKIIEMIDLGEYAPELSGQYLHVWVNPPIKMLREHNGILSAKNIPADQRMQSFYEFYAAWWSHGPEGTHWTAEEIREAEEHDPAFVSWLVSRSWSARRNHIEEKKKG